MSRQIVKQPDGKLAVWSSIVDDFIIIDASEVELITFFRNEAAEEAERHTKRMIASATEEDYQDHMDFKKLLGK